MQAGSKDNDIYPQGVTLYDWNDFDSRRKNIYDAIKTSVTKAFPQTYGGVRLELADVDYVDPESYSIADQKDALLSNKFLHRRLRGKYRLFDDKTNELLEEKEATILRAPFLSNRGTFLHNGSEYSTLSQARLMPGVYTRRKASGELETHFNARRGSGSSFRVRLEPETGLFKMDIGQSSLRLYSLLKDIGVSDEDLEKRWGPELLETNRKAYDARVFEKAYARLVRNADTTLDREAKANAIREALSATRLDRGVTERTLPNLFNAKVAAAWQAAPAQSMLQEESESPSKSDFNKSEYMLLAQFLNKEFHTGIPLDLPTSDLVAMLLEKLQTLMPDVNPDVLAMAVKNKQNNEGMQPEP